MPEPKSDNPNQDRKASFGYREVPEDEKAPLVRGVFTSVASRYDLMNDLMSGGVHRLWKTAMIDWLMPRPGQAFLDLAGGTGDIAFRIAEASQRMAQVTVLDINGSMLDVGRQRAERQRLSDNLTFVEANAEDLPFDDNSFDAYTIAFGIRNVPRISVALAEAMRVLKRGGRFLCLEFSQVDAPVLEKAYDAWSFNAIPQFGRAITGDGEPYRYLVESIRKFPNQRDFATMIETAGLSRVKWTNYTGGVAALHSAWKL